MLPLPVLIAECAPNVAPGTMHRLVSHESAANPFAIGVNDKEVRLKRQPRSAVEASNWASWLIERGYSIDLGVAQINHKNLSLLGLDLVSVFDPCSNLRASSQLLSDNYRRAVIRYGEGQLALEAALSAYNTGRFVSSIGAEYVAKLRSVRVVDPGR
jgi:type IV secretion system protein VirB1